VCGIFGVARFCTFCVGSVLCVDCLVWLRSVQFVYECLMWGVFEVARFCTVCVRVSDMWSVRCGYGLHSLCWECVVWLRSVQFVWGLSGVWTV